MKGSNKQTTRLLIIVVVVLILAIFYMIGNSLAEQKKSIDAENVTLQTRVDELNNKIQYQALYEKEIENAKKAIPEILDLYGPGNTPEKSIMFVVQLADATVSEVASITFGEEELFFSTTNISSVDGMGVYGYTSKLTFPVKTDYQGLKGIIDYINTYEERMTIDAINMSYDQQTGDLAGTIDVNLYAITGTEKVYEAPATGVSQIGTTNIFGTGR